MQQFKIAGREIGAKRMIAIIQGTLIFIASALILYDVHLASDGIDGNTISEVIRDFTDEAFFTLIYFWGALAAHFFIPRKGLVGKVTIRRNVYGMLIILLSGAVIGVVCGNLFELNGTVDVPLRVAIGALGVIAGYIFWPQSYKETPLD